MLDQRGELRLHTDVLFHQLWLQLHAYARFVFFPSFRFLTGPVLCGPLVLFRVRLAALDSLSFCASSSLFLFAAVV